MLVWDKLSFQNPSQLKKIQSQKFRFALRHLVPYSPFYQDFFKKYNLSFADFKSIDDIVKLPFISKLDILPTETEPAKPRQFILQPDETKIKKYAPKLQLLKMLGKKIIGKDPKKDLISEFKPIHSHFTTGRSTNQIPYLYSTYDINNLRESGYRIFQTIGASQDDVAISAFPFAPHLAFWLGYHGTSKAQILSLQTGGGKMMGTVKIINAIPKLKATIFLAIPGYAYHLFRRAVKEKADLSSIKFVVMGGERVCPGLRRKIEGMLAQGGAKDVKILATYALTEGKTAWVQCHEESGYHLYPDLEYIELVDKEGKVVPEGEKGEVVYTALDWRGSFVMRYRTGDICEGLTVSKPCPYCQRTVPRLHYDIQRQSEVKDLYISKVKGELVNLNIFHKVIHDIAEIEEWQVEIKKKNNDPFDLDELYIYIALRPGANQANIESKLVELISEHTSVNPIVICYELPVLLEMLGMEKEMKEKRIVDSRKK